jgi:hypothetical protein
MTDIQPIETRYRGHRFRSRLEARWACAFDAVGLRWEYEKEGYVLDDGTPYLADFWLTDAQVWVECKGQPPTEAELNRCRGLRDKTGNAVFVSHGLPNENSGTLFCWDQSGDGGGTAEVSDFGFFPWHAETWTRISAHETLFANVGMSIVLSLTNDPLILEVMSAAARSARFEHGESGAA